MRDRLQEASRVEEVTGLNTSFQPDKKDLQQLFFPFVFLFIWSLLERVNEVNLF